MNKIHEVSNVGFRDGKLVLEVDGETHSFNLMDVFKKLAKATAEQRSIYTVSPSGYGIHWPLLDEDLSVDGLLGVEHRPNLEATA